MKERLINHQQKPRPFGMKTRRLNAVTKILMVLIAMMLFPMTLFSQGTGAQDYPIIFNHYVGGYNSPITVNSTNETNVLGDGTVSFSYNSTDNTGTLTLSNMDFNGWIESELDELIIEFSGVNRLTGTGVSATGNYGYIINKNTSDATLTLRPLTSESTFYIMNEYSHGAVEGFSVNLGGQTGSRAYVSSGVPTCFDSSAKYFVNYSIDNAGSTPRHPKLQSITFTGTPTYMLWVGSVADDYTQATGANLAKGGGSAVYSENTNTLTLNGAKISGDIWSALGDLTIDLQGTSTVSHTGYGGADSPIFSMNSGTLTVQTSNGAGNLTLLNTAGGNFDAGPISGFSSFTFANGLGLGKDDSNHDVIKVPSEAYDLWLGCLQVTADNMGNISGVANPDSITGTAVTFNPTTNTLTLSSATLNVGVHSNLDDLTIHLIGTNIINNSSKDAAVWSYNTSADLTFECESGATLDMRSKQYSHSVIQGFNSVNYATGANAAYLKSPHNSYWDYDYPALYGFNGQKRMIDGTYSDMDTNLTELTITSDVKYQLWVNSKQVTSDNYGDVLGDNKVFFSPDSYLLILTDASFDGAIISGLDALTVEFNGSNSLGTSGGYILSSDPNAVLKLKATNTTSTLDLQHSVNRAVLEGFKSVDLDGVYFTNSGVTYDETNRQMKGQYGLAQSLSLVAGTTSYDLWVCGTQVTSANASNILNNGRAIYTPSTNTLTLVGNSGSSVTTLSSSGTSVIKSGMDNINVILQDGVRFDCTDGAYAFEGTLSGATVTFNPGSTTSGSLLFHDSNDFYKDITPIYQGGLAFFGSSTIGRSVIRLSPWSGTGTSADPFLIKTPDDLNSLATYVNTYQYTMDHYFKVDNDIDCSNAGTMESIGSSYYYSFKGTFDGNNGKKISNQTTPYGLFGFVGDGCVIKDLTIDNCNVTGGADECVAGLVAQIRTSSAEINNCHVINSTISGGSSTDITCAGGIVGYQWSGTVTGCSVKNSTITLPQINRTYSQNAGGITAYFYQGTISNCVVEGTTISSQNTGNKELYSGAIVGKKGYSSATLSNNTYNSGVQVRSKKGDDSEIIRSGNTQRGIGYDEVSLYDYDIFTNNGAVLSGTMSKLTVSAATNGSVEFVDGYYRVDGNDVYALPYSVSNQLTRIKGTSGVDYDSPAITITPTGAAAISPTSTTTGSDATTGADNATWSIQMPDVDATAAVTFPIDLGNGSRVFTIADFTYNGSGQAVTEIKTKKTSTSTNEITLSLTNGDITFVDYLSSTGETIGPNPPSAAGNYKISIKTGNKTIGSCEVAYKILAATASITAGDQKVTYNGAGQAYSGVTNCPGSYSVTYYPTEADRTNNSNGYTTPLPVNAGDYFVKVTQTDPNYTSSPVDAKFTIEAIEAQFTWGTTQFDYDGNPHAPTASVSNIVDGDACSVTVSGQQTNVGSSYTATISGLGSTNYKLPATAPSTTFSINPIAVGLSWTNTSFTFDGDAHKPTATATGLVGSDVCNVTVTGEQTNASETSYTATATALDNNNYKLPTTGLTQDFTISPCSLAYANIAVIPAETYSGSEIKPTPEVKITLGTSTSETTLSAETDFEYTYANNKNAAKASDNLPPTVTITGKGNYNGTRVVKFTIDQVDMSKSTDITVEAVPDQTYTGSAITPTPTVKFKGNDLVAGASNDFVYGYLNNINLASSTDPTAPPTVTITGNGNFKNTTSVKFTIKEQEASVNFGTRDYITFYNSTTGNLLVPDDVKAYIVTGVNGNEVVVDQVSFITPNTPVLMEKAPGWKNVKDNMLHSGNLLKFASSDIDATGKKYYVLYNNEFVRATGTIPIGRNYLDLSAIVNPARTLIIGGNNSATAIEAVSEEVADGEDKWYDMQGRQINKPTKAGLYIKNGKKVVVNIK